MFFSDLLKRETSLQLQWSHEYKEAVSEFNEFKSRLKSPQKQFQLSTGLNFEKFNTILSGTNHI